MEVIPTIRTSRGRDFYLAYLNSPDWRTRRNKALKDAGYQCQKCAARRGLEVHHKTYERLGAEWDQDLEVVCQDCHGDHHLEEMAASESHRIFLKLASDALRKDPAATLGELAESVKLSCVKAHIKYEAWQVDKALSILSGAKRTNAPIARTVQEVKEAQGRPLTDSEARETLKRVGLSALIKDMPRAAPSKIDIYATVREDFVDHDRY